MNRASDDQLDPARMPLPSFHFIHPEGVNSDPKESIATLEEELRMLLSTAVDLLEEEDKENPQQWAAMYLLRQARLLSERMEVVLMTSRRTAKQSAGTLATDPETLGKALVGAQHALQRIDQLLTVAAVQIDEDEPAVAHTLITTATEIAANAFEAAEKVRGQQ